jgi:hypothetical protein
MEGFRVRLEYFTEQLLSEAGKEPLTDCFNRGYITAIKDLLNISVEELE